MQRKSALLLASIWVRVCVAPTALFAIREAADYIYNVVRLHLRTVTRGPRRSRWPFQATCILYGFYTRRRYAITATKHIVTVMGRGCCDDENGDANY